MIHTDIEQGTPEWLELRRGKVTGSRIADVMATIKTGEAAARKNYRTQLALERVTGVVAETFKSTAMEHGTEWEPVARALVEIKFNYTVNQVAFVDHDEIPMAGSSPDGLIGSAGCVEIKCPNSATHIETIATRKIPREYMLQMQWLMECANRQWCLFASYDPRMPEHLRLVTITVERDEATINEIKDAVIPFLSEVNDLVDALATMKVD